MTEQPELIDDDDGLQEGQEPEEQEGQEEQEPDEAKERTKDIEVPPEIQEKINKRIGEVIGERYAAQQERDRIKQELDEIRKKLPQPERPAIPDMPDPYDDDFAAKVEARDKAIRAAAEYDAKQNYSEMQALQRQQEAERQAQQSIIKTVTDYTERAKSKGISEQDLQQAGNTVAAYGIGNELTGHILMDAQGPEITMHLARNPTDVQAMFGMTPMQAAIYIETNVKPKLGEKKPKAPPPPEQVEGGGVPPLETGPMTKGAKFW